MGFAFGCSRLFGFGEFIEADHMGLAFGCSRLLGFSEFIEAGHMGFIWKGIGIILKCLRPDNIEWLFFFQVEYFYTFVVDELFKVIPTAHVMLLRKVFFVIRGLINS